ncbi:RNA polymerase sigma-E factor [Cellulomonas soli]|uniref:RNA polymerase sigma-E factor n=2 Tax=Cellulomonas soli TaxID=931535 RepID=A0A512PGM6_9CELL|nr:RNA polymerase sigma-E factor [Cellulomonas soli]
MDGARRRSDDLMAEVVRERGSALGAYAYLLTGNTRDAEDLLQDALVKTFVRARSLDLTSAEGYLRRVMVTTWIDGVRRRNQWQRVRHLLTRDERDEGHAEQVAARQDVQAALDGLSRRQRACVVLRFWDDLTVHEIADRLGLADGTVKRYLSTGVARLSEVLGPIALARPDDVSFVLDGGAR